MMAVDVVDAGVEALARIDTVDRLARGRHVRVGDLQQLHSGLAPEVLITFAHFAISAWMKAANSRGVLPMGSAPCAESCFCISGFLSAFTTSAWMRSTISGGVPTGAKMPYHEPASNPAKPDSIIVGSS